MPIVPWTPEKVKKMSELNGGCLTNFTAEKTPFLYLNHIISMLIFVSRATDRTNDSMQRFGHVAGHSPLAQLTGDPFARAPSSEGAPQRTKGTFPVRTSRQPRSSEEVLTSENRPKRILDIVIATSLFGLLFPLLIVLATLVRLNGPGPVIYRQTRVGANGKNFTLLKFRTMNHSEKFLQATVNDRRVTSVGRVLRRTSLDELPQLLNVIRGDMSLVGPRPHAAETCIQGIFFEDAVKSYRQRHKVRPGITGLAQIRGQRGETRTIQGFEQRMSSDLEYIENWSMWLDVLILLKTVPVLFGQENAY
jgi:lipopolysaccharide/colanic/teichoic acid biosynthesis glycosyltransferase